MNNWGPIIFIAVVAVIGIGVGAFFLWLRPGKSGGEE